MVNNRLFIFFFLIEIIPPTTRSINGTDVSANTSSTGPGGLNTSGGVISGFVVRFVVLNFLIMLVWLAQKQKKGRKKNIGYIICLCYLPKKIQVIYQTLLHYSILIDHTTLIL